MKRALPQPPFFPLLFGIPFQICFHYYNVVKVYIIILYIGVVGFSIMMN